MTDSEAKRFLEFVNKRSAQIKMIFLILIFLGMRGIEVVSLKVSNIMGNKITFRQAKSHKLHTRVMPDYIKDLLYQYISKYQDKFIDNFIFPPCNNRSRNSHITTGTIRWALKRFRNQYNLNDYYYICRNGKKLYRISVHTIRHYFLTKFYKSSGNDLLLTAEVVGHKKIEQTADYIKAWKKFEREGEIVNKMVMEI